MPGLRRNWLFLPLLFPAFHAAAQTGPAQPVPYSHKLHAGDLKLQCASCHTNPDPGEAMTIPQAAGCKTCHAKAPFVTSGEEIKWVRVYQVPNFVFFSHRSHIAANTCEDCHGPVAQRVQLAREKDLSMGSCMNCHREKKVSNDCTFCHDAR